ncbi:sugar transferase [Carnobacterium maltaromaticum]|uniref:sugar transferase n=1 Tax=Carnobacterium maltaromaticum TaxID=2751 RepID=UPI0019E752D4|nr:sugar transferase [Carnobacterium maltaromaticum]CAD5902912.1 Glycosyl transferase [Carnobacterium maltaromaticum]
MKISKKFTDNYSEFYNYRQMNIGIKRLIDIVLSIIGLVLTAPLLGILIILIRLEDGHPGIFIQTRTGKDGKSFSIYKLRSMTVTEAPENIPVDSSWENGVPDDYQFKKNDDLQPHITRIGSFIRKTSLDELPQLWNVLTGSMSFIGPRPEIPAITSYYNKQQCYRLKVKPGLTGWAQVNGRSNIANGEKLNLDMYYIDHWSLRFDVIIILKTIYVVFTRKGAI